MDRIERAAVISCLADKLWCQESWCGETHIQKAVYVLHELKRHIPETAAQEAVKELDEIKTEASRCLAAVG